MILTELDLINMARVKLPDFSTYRGSEYWVCVLLDRQTKHWLNTKFLYANVKFVKALTQWDYAEYELSNQKQVTPPLNLPTLAILYDEWRSQGYEGSFLEFVQSLQGRDGVSPLSGYMLETPAGAVDGINATYTSSFDFIPETVKVYVNGLLMKRLQDFNTYGTNQINMSVSLGVGETIQIDYYKQLN